MRQATTGGSRRYLALALMPVLLPALTVAASRSHGGSEVVGHEQGRSQADGRPYLLETVGEFAVTRLYADGFEELTPRERVVAFYLYRAALAGRDIYYDQMGRYNLEVRDLLEEILTHPRQVAPGTLQSLHGYLKLFWINNGNHNERTKRKFLPAFGFDDLRAAAVAAERDGADIRIALGETLERKLERLRPAIFDPRFEPLVTCKSPPPGKDILACSSVNYYEGVTLDDLKGFHERHPLNSRLVRGPDGRLLEEVYRAGRDKAPAGRYAGELLAMAGFLSKARAHAEQGQAAALGDLVDYFSTGDPEAFRAYNVAWVRDESAVDVIAGFIESYKDPRSRKGAYEGLVYFLDRRMAGTQKALAALAQYFEDRAPWADAYKRKGFNAPLASAVTLLSGVGDGGPMPPVGINLPNEEAIRERHGSKSVSLINVLDAGRRTMEGKTIGEFVLPEDRALLERLGAEVHLMQTTMHEALGHAAGKVSDRLAGDPSDHLREYYAALEEARAELVALHDFFDPKLLETGVISSPDVPVAAYKDFVSNDLIMLRRVREGEVLEDDHMRATHLIVSYLRHASGGVEEVRRDGKAYMRVADVAAMRRGVAALLAEVQRIKGEGDYAAARSLIERFGTRIDPRLRDEVVARAAKAGIASYVAFVMPDIVPLRDAAGDVVDARVEYTSDLTMQMLKYSGKLPLEGAPASSDRLR
jgi:dipeptidyl-peptidase III